MCGEKERGLNGLNGLVRIFWYGVVKRNLPGGRQARMTRIERIGLPGGRQARIFWWGVEKERGLNGLNGFARIF